MTRNLAACSPIKRGSSEAENLLSLCRIGGWDSLSPMPVLTSPDGNIIATFYEDIWPTKGLEAGRAKTPPIHFSSADKLLPRKMINQLKAIALAMFYHDINVRRPKSIVTTVNTARNLAVGLLELGIDNLNGVDSEVILQLHSSTSWNSSTESAFLGINSAWDNSETLPFAPAEKFTHKKLNISINTFAKSEVN